MQRREATKLLLTGALATPTLLRPSFATERGAPSTESEIEKTRQLRLSLTNQIIVPSYFCILVVSAAVTIPLVFWAQAFTNRIDWEKSNQGDATGLPIVGQLFGEPPSKILARSLLLGVFFFVGSMLILRILANSSRQAEFDPPDRLSFLNRDNHFSTNFKAQKTALPAGLEQYDFDRAQPIGRGYFDKKSRTLTGYFDPVVGILEPK